MENFFLEYVYKIINEDIYNEELVIDFKVIGDKLCYTVDDLEDNAINNKSATAKYTVIANIKSFNLEKINNNKFLMPKESVIKLKNMILKRNKIKGFIFDVTGIKDKDLEIDQLSSEFRLENEDKNVESALKRLFFPVKNNGYIPFTQFSGDASIKDSYKNNTDELETELIKNNFNVMEYSSKKPEERAKELKFFIDNKKIINGKFISQKIIQKIIQNKPLKKEDFQDHLLEIDKIIFYLGNHLEKDFKHLFSKISSSYVLTVKSKRDFPFIKTKK